MANEEQLSILKQGVEVWNKWRDENREIKIDLSTANLSNTRLREVNLRHAHLIQVNLSSSDLIGADLSDANIIQANLSGSYLSQTYLRRADLMGADLIDADLIGADLTEADLRAANLRNARIGRTNFSSLYLSRTKGLEEVVHIFPSTIGTNTLQYSNGKIPEVFLRGCGLSDWEIEMVKLYNPELSNEERNKILYKIYDIQASQAIQISPLFISYSHADSEFVDKIGNRLTKNGIRYWRDIHKATAGPLEEQIDKAIRQNPTVLIVFSENSTKSDWVQHEVRKARELAKELGRHVLCPVALDDSWMNSSWPERVMEQVKEYNILDFSAWEDDVKFEGMFRKLIDGLELFYKG